MKNNNPTIIVLGNTFELLPPLVIPSDMTPRQARKHRETRKKKGRKV